jgi:pimeloyl-ACP methyl ester carboxylesterase
VRINSFFHVREVLDSYALFISIRHRESEEELQNPHAFSFWKAFSDLPVNRMFLRDPHRTHYHRGIPDIGNDLYELRDYILEYIESRRIERVVVVGTSAGGYAALVIAKLLEMKRPDLPLRVHAYDPQTSLRYETMRDRCRQRWGFIKAPSPTPELMEVVPLFRQNPSTGDQRYKAIIGTEWEDHEYAAELRTLNELPEYGSRWRPRLVLRNTRKKESLHGTEIVRQTRDGRLRKIVFKDFDMRR